MPAASSRRSPPPRASRTGRLIIAAVNDRHQSVTVSVRIQKVSFDGRMLEEETAEATVPAERAARVWSFAAPPADDYFLVVDARVGGGSVGYDSMLRTVVLPDKPKRFEFPEATVTVEPVARQPDAFAITADKPAFFVRPEAAGFDGAFEDASFLLLPGEKRTLGFRSYDGRMPEVKDITVMHLAETYR